MKIRVNLNAHIDLDIEHPTFIEMLDPRNVVDLGEGVLAPKTHNDDRSWMALDGYLSMMIERAGRAALQLTIESAENLCRGCGCTDSQACEGGCSWVEADLCSSCQPRGEP